MSSCHAATAFSFTNGAAPALLRRLDRDRASSEGNGTISAPPVGGLLLWGHSSLSAPGGIRCRVRTPGSQIPASASGLDLEWSCWKYVLYLTAEHGGNVQGEPNRRFP